LPVLLWRLNRLVLRGLEKDVVTLQKRNALLSWDIEDMHARAPHYDNRAEYMYSALQILTASTASFIHGANDVANSIGPFATAYDIWRSGKVETSVGVPLWILCFGGGAIVLGLLTYGYHVMRNLGHRLTLISPSRGFVMELASAITVLMATRLALPVSTTQCIAGATAAGVAADEVQVRRLLHGTLDGRKSPGTVLANDGMTVEKCAKFCIDKGFSRFGVHLARECFCGAQRAAGSVAATERDCNMACSGNSGQKCGGTCRLNVFFWP
ncbi:phosphate-repressible na+ phosphate cotransporter, partial [Colletotrichum chrysophilum]